MISSTYDFLDTFKHIHHVGCLAHARRMFVDEAKIVPKKQGVISHADEAVKMFARLYQVKKKLRESGMDAGEKTAYREEHARPILEEFKSWLDKNALITLPKSALGKAISYTLGQLAHLIRYMEQAFISPDNNRAENAIYPYPLLGHDMRAGRPRSLGRIAMRGRFWQCRQYLREGALFECD